MLVETQVVKNSADMITVVDKITLLIVVGKSFGNHYGPK